MKPEEVIQAKIAEMGHVWEMTADRTQTPVLLTPAAEEGADVWELWLKGARHPDWQVIHRRLTKDEAVALQAYVRESPWAGDYPAFDFYVRDGRGRDWNRSLVTGALPRRKLDPAACFVFTGSLEEPSDAPECPYDRHIGASPLSEDAPFTGDPRSHGVVVTRHSSEYGNDYARYDLGSAEWCDEAVSMHDPDSNRRDACRRKA